MRNYRFIKPTIPTKQYVQLIEELLDSCHKCKVRVKFRHGPPLGGEYLPDNVSGWCSVDSIVITLHGKPRDIEVLHCLAHELRHAQHRKYGMFGNYYKYTTPKTIFNHLEENLLAERECEKFASKWLEVHGVRSVRYGLYQAIDTNLMKTLASWGYDKKTLMFLSMCIEDRVGVSFCCHRKQLLLTVST